MQREILLKRVKRLGIIFAVWTALALIPGIQAHAYIASLGHPITWAHALVPPLLNHWIWAVLTPGVFWLSGRYPIERRAWARVMGIHLLGSFAFAVLHIVLRCPFIRSATLFTSPPARITWLLIRNSLFANYYEDLWMYSSLVAFKQLWDYYPTEGHEHELVIQFQDEDHITERWTWRQGGKDTEMVYHFARKNRNSR